MRPGSALLLLFYLVSLRVAGCQCPPTALSTAECARYELIFRGTVISVKDCDDRYGEAMFRLSELYKGNAAEEFKMLFRCDEPCARKYQSGDEWIIYTRYKQIDNGLMDWCSRSRKFFKFDQQDFYLSNFGNTYEEELSFLRSELGNHRFLTNQTNQSADRHQRPDTRQMIIILLCSLGGIILFYFLFNRLFK